MELTNREADLVFSIMNDLTGELAFDDVRLRLGEKLLSLLNADHFISYVWNEDVKRFEACVQINMSTDNLAQYETYFRFRDPIIDTLQRRKRTTLVSEVMEHKRLVRTEFFNDFLKKDGLCYGLNYFAYDRGQNIGDLRIWRSERREDFSKKDAKLIDAIAPSIVNAFVRAQAKITRNGMMRFATSREFFGLTKREAEVADLAVLGLSDEEICCKLGFAKPTLRSHIQSVFQKTNVNRRSKLALLLTPENHQL